MINFFCCCLKKDAQVHLQDKPVTTEYENIHKACQNNHFKNPIPFKNDMRLKKITKIKENSTSFQIYKRTQEVSDNLLNSFKIDQIRRALPELKKEYQSFLAQKVDGGFPLEVTNLEYLEDMVQRGFEPVGNRNLCFYLWVIALDKTIPMASKIEIITHTLKQTDYDLLSYFYTLPIEMAMPILQCLSPIQELLDPSVRAIKKYEEVQNEPFIFPAHEEKFFSNNPLPHIKEDDEIRAFEYED